MKKKIIALSTIALIGATSMTAFANSDNDLKLENETSQAQPRAQYSTINANNVNLRKTYGTSGTVLKKLNKGNRVLEYSDPVKVANGMRWQKVSHNGTVGWVAEKYLTPDGR